MRSKTDETGHRQPLHKRFKQILAATAVAVAMTAGAAFLMPGVVEAGGETRTLNLYHTHTKERLQVTYKVNGRYVPSAMKKINYIMRDWRRNSTVKMDPKTIDLMWELHTDLGSRKPIHIVCGYRSAKTNGFLKKIGRGVAKKSQHVKGKAIDLYFPDVSSEKIRNSALVRQVGGVGYYRRSAGPTGFVHIDSGNVRHWPRLAPSKLAKIFRDNRKTVGRRLNRNDQVMVASAEEEVKLKKLASAAASQGDEFDEETDNGAEIAPEKDAKAEKAKEKEKPEELVSASLVPVPRAKPIEVLFMAANVEPASAPPEKQVPARARPAADSLGTVEAAETLIEEPSFEQASNRSAKSGFAEELLTGEAKGTPMIKTLSASASSEDELFWWPKTITFEGESTVRRDGAPQKFELDQGQLASLAAASEGLEEPASVEPAAAAAMQTTVASGKGDMLIVNRTSKGSLLFDAPQGGKRQKLGQLRLEENSVIE
jgi:uncharacterized protein YcbK (DUF882 family)